MIRERKFDAQIVYRMKSTHPDYDKLTTGNWFRERFLTYEDTYTFNDMHDGVSDEGLKEYIKRDLRLVAGGGYTDEHITDVSFLIKRVL